jgi:adenosylmethionine-8-amino-7-oxononanoate aminotransferase
MASQLPTSLDDYDRQDVWRKDHDHFLHPWAEFPRFEKHGSLVISEGEGAYVYDSDGKRYLDGIAGLWCVNIGYGNREMARTLAEQACRLPFFNTFVDTTNPPAAELAAKLAELAPAPLNHVFYGSGGSVANETAVRTAHFYFKRLGRPEKKLLISRKQAYHGSTYITMSLSGKPEEQASFHLATDLVHYVSAPDPYRRPQGSTLEGFCDQLVEELEAKILELGPEKVAAFFAEPILGAGGVIVPPPGYHRRTQEVCRKYDVLYVSDEVVTAFGRLGHMMASEPVFGLSPDIITCAKGISSGYVPLGATLISDAIHEVIRNPASQADCAFGHGFTYSGHALCCAVGLKNIEIIEREGICQRVRELGPYFEKRLATLVDLPLVGDVRGRDFMLCVENVADKQTKQLLPEKIDVGRRIADHCEERGVIVRPIGHLNVISPPLILTRDQIDTIVEVLREAILATADDLVRERLWSG